MKNYKKYMDRQRVSEELHNKILESAEKGQEPRQRKRWNPVAAMGAVAVIGAALLATGIWDFDRYQDGKANMENTSGQPETTAAMAAGEIVEETAAGLPQTDKGLEASDTAASYGDQQAAGEAACGEEILSYQELQALEFGMLLPEEEQIPLPLQTTRVTLAEDGSIGTCRIEFEDPDTASYLTLIVQPVTGEAGAEVWQSSQAEGVFWIYAVKYYDSYQVSYESKGIAEELLQQIMESVHP